MNLVMKINTKQDFDAKKAKKRCISHQIFRGWCN